MRVPTVESRTGGIGARPGICGKLPRVFDAFRIPSVLAKVTLALASCSLGQKDNLMFLTFPKRPKYPFKFRIDMSGGMLLTRICEAGDALRGSGSSTHRLHAGCCFDAVNVVRTLFP